MCVELSASDANRATEGDAAAAPPLFVVVNPASGGCDAEQTRSLVARIVSEAGRRALFADVDSPAKLTQACARAAAQARREGGVLVAAGGDGTINAAAQAALAHHCPLGVIPQGTFNFLAREHGIPDDVESATQALLGARPMPVQAGLANGQLFLISASLGLYPQLLQDREAFNAQLGRKPWVAAVAGLATLFKWRRQMVLDIELDGARTVLRTPTLFIANIRLQVERLGIDADMASRVGRGRLVGLATRAIGSWAMLGLVLRGALGRLGEADQVRSFSFQQLDVNVRGMRRVKVATDGEVHVMLPPVCFRVAPQPLLLMIPAQERKPGE